MMRILTTKKDQKNKAIIVTVLLMLVLPILAFSSSKSDIYVAVDASGNQDGSKSHPYKTINQALAVAKEGSEIHVAKGEYKENIEIKRDVDILGEDKDDVIIKAKDDDDAVVVMYDKSKINKVTIKGGKNGIFVQGHAKASIIKCVIKDNDRNGIEIEGEDRTEKNIVSISENEIKNNGKAGIYSETRRLSIVDNNIHNNKGDGIDVSNKKSIAWISGNKIEDNKKSGMKLTIDGSEIWTKGNKIKNNKREGIEVSFFGEAGRVDIAKTTIEKNDRFGVARVQRFGNYVLGKLWNQYLTFDSRNKISSNAFGDISNIIIVK